MNNPSRRDFLKTAAVVASSAALVGRSTVAAEAAPKRIRKAIMFATVGVPGTTLEKFKILKEVGFEGVEPMSHMNQDEVLAARDATGLEICSVCCNTHWAKPLSSPSEDVRKVGLEGLLHTLRDAHRYGASSVLFVPAVVDKTISYAEAYTRSQAEIRKALPLAAELKVKIAIENVWNQFLLSPLEAARYVDEFQSPWVGWHFDVGNVINYGWPEQWIRILGPRIQKLHIKEFSRKRRDNEGLWTGFSVGFLEGDNDWPSIMKALGDIKYSGWGIAEQGGGDTKEGLRSLSEKMDKIFAS